MSDVFWAALVGAGAALLGGALTQLSALTREHMQRKSTERQQEVNWQRSEARRMQESRQKTSHRQEEFVLARIRECWEHVLMARVQMYRRVDHFAGKRDLGPVDEMPSAEAGRACLVAMLGLSEVFELAVEFYQASLRLEVGMDNGKPKLEVTGLLAEWEGAFQLFQKGILKVARERLPTVGAPVLGNDAGGSAQGFGGVAQHAS